MPLKKATKTVLFHDGMGDDSDRFLLEPPAVDYAENLRIDKTGSLQKRPGFGPDALTTVPDSSGTPVAMHGMGNDLHVITEEGARTWNGTEWRQVDANGFVGGSEMELESQNFLGLANCSYQPITDVNDGSILGHILAYEVREEGSAAGDETGGNKHIVIQRYNENGVFFDQLKIDNARSPQVVATFASAGRPINAVFYESDARGFGELVIQYVLAPVFASDLSPNPWLTSIRPEHSPQMPQYAATDTGPRLGQGVHGQSRYLVKYLDSTDKFVVFSHVGHVLFLTVLNLDGTLDQVPNRINIPLDTEDHVGDLLGLDVILGVIFIVYQQAELSGSGSPVGDWSTKTAMYGSDLLAGEIFSVVLESGVGSREFMPTFTHGTISTHWDGTLYGYKSFIAYHYSGFQSASALSTSGSQVAAEYWYPYNNRHPEVGLRVWEVEWVPLTVQQHQILHAHRITTNPCYFNDKWYMGVQQWIDYTPQHEDPGGCNQYVLADAAAKPVTTAICVWQQGQKITPVATLDAGQSCHVDYAESEAAIHLGTLVEQGGDLLASNRVKLRAEDTSVYLGAKASKWMRRSNLEVGSDSLCRVHRITPGGEGVYSAEFGDGIALSTAVPLWYESGGFGEFGPLDSPEILRVEDADYADRTNLSNEEWMQSAPPQGYHEMASNHSLDFRKFVCVWGYIDGRGNTHRSAPSATLYVADLTEKETAAFDNDTKWSGREVTIWVTTPLSLLPDDREYFAEIYISTDVDTDPQLAAQFSIDIADCGTPKKTTFQLNRVIPSDEDIAKPVIRSTAPDYTSGGVLAADPWPAFKKSVVQSTRFWCIDSTNKGRVIYSKLFEDFIAPEYNPTLSINLGDERDLTAIGKLDDKVVVFEPDDIHVIYGEGPDNRGQGQDFAVHYISTDVGCTDQESVIETPAGLIFYSEPRGFYLLDRNLQVQFIGGGIEDTARGISIVSATLVRDRAEVRFVYTGGPSDYEDLFGPNADTDAIERPPRPVFTNVSGAGSALTFNYERGTWMVYDNYLAEASTIYQGKYTMLRPDWDIWQEKEDRWDDPTGSNLTTFRTPWIKLSENIQDFNRLWSMTIIGRYLSSLQDLGTEEYEASDVRLRIWYDYEGEYAQSKDIRVQDLGYDPFNNPPKRAERFQFEVTPQRGRCQAIKLEFSEVVSQDRGEGLTYKQGRGFEIVSVDFHVGVGPSRTLIPQRSKK
jgi:hypothetical protein